MENLTIFLGWSSFNIHVQPTSVNFAIVLECISFFCTSALNLLAMYLTSKSPDMKVKKNLQ